VILANQSDWPTSRIFTLMHELGHLILDHTGGICDPLRHSDDRSGPVEARCNRFAGAVLIPTEHLQLQREVAFLRHESDPLKLTRYVRAIAGRYRVSAQAMAYRLRELQLLSQAKFRAVWGQLISAAPPPHRESDRALTTPRWRRAETGYGPHVVRALVTAANRGVLSESRLVRVLNVAVGDLAHFQGS
jgi:Zn-dependent peptidase ImmA (M78 family)